jgi:hypothetical protein
MALNEKYKISGRRGRKGYAEKITKKKNTKSASIEFIAIFSIQLSSSFLLSFFASFA